MKSFKTIREDIKKVIKGNELFILFSLITIILSVSSLSLAKRSLELDESKTKNMKLDVRVGFDDIDSIDFASIIQIAFSVIEGNSSEDCYFSFVYMPRLVNNNNRSIENLEYDIDVNRLAYINDSNNMVYYKLPDLELSKDFELADTTHLHFKYKKNRINAFCTTDVLFNKIDTTISYMSLNTSLGITHDGIKYKRNIPYSMYYFKKDGLTIKNILDAAFDSIYKDYKYYGIAPDYILLSFNHESVGFRNFEYFNRSKYHFDSIDDMDDLNIKKMRQSNRSFSLSVYIYFTISFVLVLFFELMLLIRVIKRTKKQIIPYYKEHRRLPRGYELDPPQLYFWSTYISLIIAIIVLFFLYISAIQYLRYI